MRKLAPILKFSRGQIIKINKKMSEIDDDLKISHLELSNNLGLTLTGTNQRIKHT